MKTHSRPQPFIRFHIHPNKDGSITNENFLHAAISDLVKYTGDKAPRGVYFVEGVTHSFNQDGLIEVQIDCSDSIYFSRTIASYMELGIARVEPLT